MMCTSRRIRETGQPFADVIAFALTGPQTKMLTILHAYTMRTHREHDYQFTFLLAWSDRFKSCAETLQALN